ncbi:MAG: xylose isomerase [Planctomycetaceae bacterium]|jgi:hexulose-6-phosphate isomerase|nr:xylose isomerase [Planctomycetaceae bacterium]MDP7275210.1 sugar phosphate isomerase/epimerase family protein [Planctomycetaceae bacterium]
MNQPIDRREFLAVAAAATAASSAAPAAEADKPAKKKPSTRLRKAVKYSMVAGKASVIEKFKLLVDVGFEGVDINVRLDHDEVNKASEKTGLVVHGVVGYDHWRKPFSHPDRRVRDAGRESFLGAIRDAKAYGATSALLVPGVANKQVSYQDAYRRSQAEIRKCLPLAEKLGIQILIENVWNNLLLSPLEAARYIDELKSPLVGAYFDVGNVVRFGWPEQWIRTLGDRIKKLDIKEYSRKLQNQKGPYAGFGVKLGDGDCDWPAVMRALDEIKFPVGGGQGWATAEVSGGDAARLRDISQRMDRIFATR